jgi:hypothetical protein
LAAAYKDRTIQSSADLIKNLTHIQGETGGQIDEASIYNSCITSMGFLFERNSIGMLALKRLPFRYKKFEFITCPYDAVPARGEVGDSGHFEIEVL